MIAGDEKVGVAAEGGGEDQVRRNVLTRVVVGARVSLLAGVTVIGLALTIGTLLGAIAGYLGGASAI